MRLLRVVAFVGFHQVEDEVRVVLRQLEEGLLAAQLVEKGVVPVLPQGVGDLLAVGLGRLDALPAAAAAGFLRMLLARQLLRRSDVVRRLVEHGDPQPPIRHRHLSVNVPRCR